MAGDTLRDAFRNELAAVRDALGIVRPIRDLLNAGVRPDASQGFLALEFPGGSEEQYTAGAPGNNLWLEVGQVTVRVYQPIGATKEGRDAAERDAEAIRIAFRGRLIAVGDRTLRVDTTAPMGLGQDEGGLWAESVALGYRRYNVG